MRPHRANGIWGSLLELVSHMFTKLYGQLGNKWFSTYLSTALSWTVHPQKIWWTPDPITMNVTLFRSRVFADVIKLTWGHTRLGWALNPIELVSLKGKRNVSTDRGRTMWWDTWRRRSRKDGSRSQRAIYKPRDTGDCSHRQKLGVRFKRKPSDETSQPGPHLDLRPLASRTVRK